MFYEYLYRQINNREVRDTIDFLLNREEAHNQMLRDAFKQVQNSGSNQDFGTTKRPQGCISPCLTLAPMLLPENRSNHRNSLTDILLQQPHFLVVNAGEVIPGPVHAPFAHILWDRYRTLL